MYQGDFEEKNFQGLGDFSLFELKAFGCMKATVLFRNKPLYSIEALACDKIKKKEDGRFELNFIYNFNEKQHKDLPNKEKVKDFITFLKKTLAV